MEIIWSEQTESQMEKKKWKQHKRPMGQCKMCQATHKRGYRRRRKKNGTDYVFEEMMAENFPNLEQEAYIQIQEAQSPKWDKPKQTYPKI